MFGRRRRDRFQRGASMISGLAFQSIKSRVTLETLLRHYHVELQRSGKDQYRGCCPIHGADGTVLDFVAAMEGCTLFEAARRLQAMRSLSVTSKPKKLVTERKRFIAPLKFQLTGIDYSHPYLTERGIAEKTAMEFGVGFYVGP